MARCEGSGKGRQPLPLPRLQPLRGPEKFSAHELEDMDKMAEVIFFESKDPALWVARPLHEVLLFQALLGRRLPDELVGVTAATDRACLSWRVTSFPAGWAGLSPLEMALCGLYLNNEGKVQCFMCGVAFRGLTGVDVDVCLRHKQLAPRCLQLQRYKCDGPHPTPPGKRVRRNSEGDLYDLVKACTHDVTA